MSQQINLLNPALIRPRDWVSLKNVAVIYMLAVAGMGWFYTVTQSEADALQQQRNTVVVAYEAAQAELVQVSNEKSLTSSALAQEQELQQLMRKKEMQRQLLSSFKHVQQETGHHVLDYMQGFARQPLPGVWLVGFKLNAFEQTLSLTGRALQSEKVPQYLEQLAHEPVFQGHNFGGVTLKAMTQNDEYALSETTGAATEAASSTAAKVSKGRPPLSFIEFDVRGLPASAADAELPVQQGGAHG